MLRYNRSWLLFLIFVLLALVAYCFRHELYLWATELYCEFRFWVDDIWGPGWQGEIASG